MFMNRMVKNVIIIIILSSTRPVKTHYGYYETESIYIFRGLLKMFLILAILST
jgi:hypothetical protein